MSKKDYQAIALAIHEAKPALFVSRSDGASLQPIREDVWRITRNMVADALAADNSRFSRERFIEACETGKCKGMKERIA